MNNLKKAAVTATLISLSAAVFANTTEIPAAHNIYVGVNAGFSRAILSDKNTSIISSNSFATVKADAGYKLNGYIAAEAGFGYLFNKADGQSYDIYYPYAAAKFMLPVINNSGDLYLKAGVADADFKNANDDGSTFRKFGAYVGIGGDVTFTPNLGLNIDMSGPMVEEGSVNVFLPAYTIGLTYSF